ncbi:hypothetical protein LAUMK13_02489 [Mycobacterium innocens]|uniref:Uncharacterized protein n=1 Tax=Mycobacterium innocens TaxID=2341083 RepID=A0A498Q1N2_9MYCO|nr:MULTISPECIES: hypothetical protein [Mycobacterium]VBA39231.1 hypothetical protein LAUMK13_02489 [Mycobacterium innocens]
MTIDPDQIRSEIEALVAQLPDVADAENGPSLAELEVIARRLSEAHDVLLRALESVEKG